MPPTSSTLSLHAPSGLPEFAAGDDLAGILLAALEHEGCPPVDGDVIVVAQKIVSKTEGRCVDLASVRSGDAALALAAETGKDARLVELLLAESVEVVRKRPGLIIARHRNGCVVANAGIDQSNTGGDNRAILLPEDADRSASALRDDIRKLAGVEVGIVVNDSMGRAWRNGTIGTAIGASGLIALLDRRGSADRDGRILQTSEIALADEVAAAASLLMGQAEESRPVVLVRGLGWALGPGKAADLVRPAETDLFR